MSNFSKAELLALLRLDFLAFAQKAFQTLNSSEPFKPNWHHQAIAYQLERCLRGECKRLLITLPPRSLKSHLVSVCLPAFLMGHNPSVKIITASYAQGLSEDFSGKTRTLMQEDWYREAFPDTQLSSTKNSLGEFATNKRGLRLATSVHGSLTGRGADCIILDDAHKAEEAFSDACRERTVNWFENTLLSRLNNMKDGCIIVVQQRIHEHDLAGHLLAKGGWDHLRLQAIAEEDQNVPLADGEFHEFKAGDVLHEAIYGQDALDERRAAVGSYIFSAQYQQEPVPAGGNLIPISKFQRYGVAPSKQPGDLIVQSWDLAQGRKETNDYSVGTTWLVRGAICFLLDVVREKVGYRDLQMRIQSSAHNCDADYILIENASVGVSMIEDVRAAGWFNVIECNPRTDKVARMTPGTADIEGGRVALPQEALWLADFERECSAFPNGVHDDQVDSLSQFLEWARSHSREQVSFNTLEAPPDEGA
ncbi:MAG: phage terminase large subunit [Rhodospirillales bacterium]